MLAVTSDSSARWVRSAANSSASLALSTGSRSNALRSAFSSQYEVAGFDSTSFIVGSCVFMGSMLRNYTCGISDGFGGNAQWGFEYGTAGISAAPARTRSCIERI